MRWFTELMARAGKVGKRTAYVRISELHIRQSKDGTWTEALGSGDIDYPRLVKLLRDRSVRPLLVLEQAVEKESPTTMTALEVATEAVARAATTSTW